MKTSFLIDCFANLDADLLSEIEEHSTLKEFETGEYIIKQRMRQKLFVNDMNKEEFAKDLKIDLQTLNRIIEGTGNRVFKKTVQKINVGLYLINGEDYCKSQF